MVTQYLSRIAHQARFEVFIRPCLRNDLCPCPLKLGRIAVQIH
jgi:hypothetical protein